MVTYKRLVKRHLALVSKMAEQFMKENSNIDGLTEEDLLSAGYEALVAAERTFDASREASFKTYATTYIKNAMLAEIMNNINCMKIKRLWKEPTVGLINIGRNNYSLTKTIIMEINNKKTNSSSQKGKFNY